MYSERIFQSGTQKMQARYVKGDADFSELRNMKYPHYHDGFEIYYFLGDQMTYFLNNRPIKLAKHDIVLVDRNIYHRTSYAQGYSQERINVSFSAEDLALLGDMEIINKITILFKKNRLSPGKKTMCRMLHDHFIRLCEARKLEGYYGIIKSRLILCELLLNLLELSDFFNGEEAENLLNPAEKRISDIVAYIHLSFSEPITLDSISKEFYISRYYLCHIFKRITGLGVTDFINRKRLSEAEMLLKYSNVSISTICQKVGFNSQAHFIGLFKKNYGLAPRAYRNKYC